MVWARLAAYWDKGHYTGGVEDATNCKSRKYRKTRKREWDDLSDEDLKQNDYRLEHGFRLLSSYRTKAGDKLDSGRCRSVFRDVPIRKQLFRFRLIGT
jgi:hypothetical protein